MFVGRVKSISSNRSTAHPSTVIEREAPGWVADEASLLFYSPYDRGAQSLGQLSLMSRGATSWAKTPLSGICSTVAKMPRGERGAFSGGLLS